jgi:hypothetical protein
MNVRVCLFVALVASASLGFELLQTRVLSALYFNNVVYMTVTIALLGFGMSGVMASVLQRRVTDTDRLAVLCAACLGLSIPLCILVASALPELFPMVPALYKMIASYFILVIPFVFAGGALSLVFMGHGKRIFALYFADLSASAVAAIFFSLLLWPLGGANLAWLCAAAAFAAFVVLAPSAGIHRAYQLLVPAFLGLWFVTTGPAIVKDQPERYKATARFFDPLFGAKPEGSAWTTIAKIDVYSDGVRDLQSSRYLGRPCNYLFIGQDNDAPTMIHGQRDLDAFARTARQGRPTEVNTLAYFMRPRAKDVLVIGVGGGVDVVEARTFGAQKIDGAEINAATVDFVTNRFRDYAKWPSWPNIHVYNQEGRHYIRNTDKKYDVVVMHGVDTFAALSSGAYVLSENYLYTVEAVKDYLNALKPEGMMVTFRWFFRQPRESIRLANLFAEAAQTVGDGPANQRIMVVNHGLWAGTFIKRRPFTVDEVRTVANLAAKEDYAWVFVPKVFGARQQDVENRLFERHHADLQIARNAYQRLLTGTAADRAVFAASYPYRIDPVYDDKPFFFEYYKGKVSNLPNEMWLHREDASSVNWNELRGPVVHFVLYILLALTTGACAAGMGIPLLLFERGGTRVRGATGLIALFASLGIGFMFIEIGCMQWLSLYLGNPMCSLMVVLAGLLFFAGCGSLLAGRMTGTAVARLRRGMLGTAVLIPVWLLVMTFVMPVTEHWALGGRVAVVLLSLLPLGLCMGIPFATSLRHLADHQPRFIPWAWGINGLTSVAASILAIILAMNIGFTAVVLSGSLIYSLGFLAFVWYANRTRQDRQVCGEAEEAGDDERFADAAAQEALLDEPVDSCFSSAVAAGGDCVPSLAEAGCMLDSSLRSE